MTSPPEPSTAPRTVVRKRSWYRSRAFVLALSVLALVASLGLVYVSPLALPALDRGSEHDWKRISEIGQTYGAVSALLSALAVLGVVASLVLQAREAKAARVQNTRIMHIDLAKTAMENPQYLDCWGGPDATRSVLLRQQHMYVNLVVSHWEMAFEVGDLTDQWVAAGADEIFAGEIGRTFWARSRTGRIATAATRRSRLLHQIIDGRYEIALRTPPRIAPALPDHGVPGVTPPRVVSDIE
ncbi:DUF6082 family protein [Streptomyces sp. 21So2-11]|uniref:DUF6082 family protein n=1 Tax=Streptomyces sp. 21So2-11 TaxID=3144408 RepID=UPI00321A806D